MDVSFSGLFAFVMYIIIALFYFFIEFPIQATIISVILICCYIAYIRVKEKGLIITPAARRRRDALVIAKIYLSPFDNIWKNQKLSNKHCSLKLGRDGVTITGRELGKDLASYRTFTIVKSRVHSRIDLWDMFCINFSHNKTYDGLVEDCRLYKTVISERVVCLKPSALVKETKVKNNVVPLRPIEKLDINNASEVELTALPGISIVVSKKIIKKREEIGGFKNIDEFFVFLKLKQHMENQLRGLVCVKKMNGTVKIERHQERNVDL